MTGEKTFYEAINLDKLVKSPHSPPLVGGDKPARLKAGKGEGDIST